MRGFIITLALFILLISGIIANYSYVNNVHDSMHRLVAQLSNTPSKTNEALLQKLSNYWNNKSTLLSISVSFREIDNLTNAINSLSAANQSGDVAQFLIYKEQTQNAIDSIMRLEKISIKNIF